MSVAVAAGVAGGDGRDRVERGWPGRWTRENESIVERLLSFVWIEDVSEEMEKSTEGLAYLRRVLERVRDEVSSSGELTETMSEWVKGRFGGQSSRLVKALEGYRKRYVANADGLSAQEAKENHQRAVLQFVEMRLEDYARLNRERWEREDKQETARQAADMLPSAEVLEKIMRYEGALNRELYRAMNQLERLQRRRGGENVPPPLTMEVVRR